MLIAGALGCATRPAPLPGATTRPQPLPGTSVIRLGPGPGQARPVTVMDLETYLVGVVAGEQALGALSPALAREAARLQAVISRTFALAHLGRHAREGFDLCSETHCQVYRRPPEAPRQRVIAEAIAQTKGMVLMFEGRPIDALFHSDCGGRTSAADAIWGGAPHPYLTSVEDGFCARNPAAAWELSVPRDQLREVLNRDGLTRVGARLDGITVVSRDAGGRAVLIALDGERSPLVRGEEFRRVVVAGLGARSLKSLHFTVGRAADGFAFVGRGFGHGAGLCQAGALDRLRAGAQSAEVLAHYYPGARLASIPLSSD